MLQLSVGMKKKDEKVLLDVTFITFLICYIYQTVGSSNSTILCKGQGTRRQSERARACRVQNITTQGFFYIIFHPKFFLFKTLLLSTQCSQAGSLASKVDLRFEYCGGYH